MSDEKRFSRIRSDPMFRKVNGAKNTKLVVDERFEGMFTDPSFNTQYQVDKYGRSVRDSASNDIKKYYRLDKKPQEEPVDEEEVDDEGPLPDVDEDEKPFPSASASEPPLDDEIAPFVWNEVSSDEEDGVDIDSDEEEEVEEKEEVPVGDETRRLAVINMDWDIIRSVDLLALFQSYIPSGSGFIKKVSILPSLFGLEHLEREKREGPPKEIWKKAGSTSVIQYSGKRGGEAEGGDIDMDELKKYELSRMKYFFAVAEFDSAKTALHVYRECDGMEVESTSNALDLRFIPDDQVFQPQQLRNIKDQATEVPANYEMVKEYTRALQQTRFDLSWDRDDPERHMITRARLTPDQIDAIDFRSYLACSSEEEEDEDEDEKKDKKKKKKRNQKELPGKDSVDSTSKLSAEEEKKRKRAEKKKKIRDRYAGLLKSITGSVSRDANEIEVTFTPGFLEGDDDKEKKDKKNKQEDLNVFQTELQKKRDRRRQASSASATSKDAPKELEEDQPFSDDEIPDDFFDEGFGASQKKSGSTTSSSAVSKTSTRKRMTEEEKEAERKKKAELELLLLDRKELASSTKKGDGASEKNMNAKKKKKKKGKDEKEKRIVGVDDQRFSELYTRPGLFPLDPTNPKYKPDTAKQIIQKRATVQKTIKESAVPDLSRASRSWGSSTPKDQTEGEKEDLLSLVASVKRKTREFEGVSDHVAKRPRN